MLLIKPLYLKSLNYFFKYLPNPFYELSNNKNTGASMFSITKMAITIKIFLMLPKILKV